MPPPLPSSLKVVAWLFILYGILSCIEVLVSLAHGRLNLNLGVLQIPCGIGLLNLRSGWRTFGIVMLWLSIIITPLAVLLITGSNATPRLTVLGYDAGPASDAAIWGMVLYAAICWVASFWSLTVLCDQRIKDLFDRPPQFLLRHQTFTSTGHDTSTPSTSTDSPPRYPCPCCGFVVFQREPGSYELCPVCDWEDDAVQLRYPLAGGASAPLADQQERFLRTLTDEKLAQLNRQGLKRCSDWRPLRVSDVDRQDLGPTTGRGYVDALLNDTPKYYWQNPAKP